MKRLVELILIGAILICMYGCNNTQMIETTISLQADPNDPGQDSSYVDLDKLTYGYTSEADLEFLASGGTHLFYTLKPVNGASALVLQTANNGLQDCENDRADFTATNIPEIIPGSTICIQTSSNKMTLLTVADFQSSAEGAATIELLIAYSGN